MLSGPAVLLAAADDAASERPACFDLPNLRSLERSRVYLYLVP
jgi:hypothetical protein